MTHDLWTSVDHYIEQHLFEPDAALDAAQAGSAAAGLPAIAVSPTQGRLLSILARSIGARRILELGTLGGYSGIWLARALPADGRLVTVEANPTHAAAARASFERAGLADRVDVRLGAALDVLPQLEQQKTGPFDFVFVDADKEHYPEYLDWSVRLCRPGALIVVDNVVWEGEVINEHSSDSAVHGIRRFMEQLAAERRVTATAIQMVGTKGYDGMAVLLVERP